LIFCDIYTESLVEFRDWLTDMIDAILKLTVGELLGTVNNSLARLSEVIIDGIEKLKTLMDGMDPEIRQKIETEVDVSMLVV
jgi:hypothetical protein